MNPISLLPTPSGGAPTPATPGEVDAGAFKQALETAGAREEPAPGEHPAVAEATTLGDADITKMAMLMALAAPVAPVVNPPAVTVQANAETQPVPDVTILVPVKKPTIAKAAHDTPAPPSSAGAGFTPVLDGAADGMTDLKAPKPARTPARPMTAETTGEAALKANAPAQAMAPESAPRPSAAASPARPAAEATVTVSVERPAPARTEARAEAPLPAPPPAYTPPLEARVSTTPTVERARPAEAQSAEVIAQIQHAVERMGETRLDTVRVQLNPEHLGRIELQVSHTSDGAVSVQVRAEQPQTVAMLERHLAELRTTLSANQLDVRHVTVSAGMTGDRRQHQPFHGKPAKIAIRGLQRAELDAGAATSGPTLSVYPTSRLALAGVDYRI